VVVYSKEVVRQILALWITNLARQIEALDWEVDELIDLVPE
jgi:hypothetical protein